MCVQTGRLPSQRPRLEGGDPLIMLLRNRSITEFPLVNITHFHNYAHYVRKVVQFILLITFATSVLAGPVALRLDYDLVGEAFSFLANFDSFCGVENLNGFRFSQIVNQDRELSAARSASRLFSSA
ncbi:hypothetical protein D9615_007770 [Tricholomella constricta]|uniref:Transmembrane protein n=1 Tax=Tricholomella constricta TaxID=117010 RepID=A0A8H5H3M6_9AGAR|nr:hypothetical protein D9615_007770 [Tricholomella constricta]